MIGLACSITVSLKQTVSIPPHTQRCKTYRAEDKIHKRHSLSCHIILHTRFSFQLCNFSSAQPTPSPAGLKQLVMFAAYCLCVFCANLSAFTGSPWIASFNSPRLSPPYFFFRVGILLVFHFPLAALLMMRRKSNVTRVTMAINVIVVVEHLLEMLLR